MAKILFTNQTDPATPAAGTTYLFVDSADKNIKTIDDTGTVTDLTSTVAASAEAYQYKTTDYTALITDDGVIINANANTVDITLPAVSTATKKVIITCIDSTFTVTINPNGSDTIEGNATRDLVATEGFTFIPDTTNNDWRLL